MAIEALVLSSIYGSNYVRLCYIVFRVIYQQNYVAQLPVLLAELPVG
jgi:hypothetical protein